MRILITSKFLHHVGGVETYVRWQANALARTGMEVGLLGMTPPPGAELMNLPDGPRWLTKTRSFEKGSPDRVKSAALSVWSPEAGAVMARALAEFRPDVVHFHGTCFQLTPAVVEAVRRAGCPNVMTAHEFKLICTNQTLFNDAAGAICMACVGASDMGKVAAPLRRSCMKGSPAVTALGAIEGRVSGRVWRRTNPRILAPSRFMRDRLVEDGWPGGRVDYLDLPWRRESDIVASDGAAAPRPNVVFLGRLAPVKRADRLIRAWDGVAADHPQSRLRILGDGAERPALEEQVARDAVPRVDFLGHVDRPQIDAELTQAAVTVHPAQWHENSPFSVRDSLMAGVPAIVSDVGGMPEMVGPASGWVVPHDDDEELRRTLAESLQGSHAGSESLRAEVQRRAVSEESHIEALHDVYRQEIERTRSPA